MTKPIAVFVVLLCGLLGAGIGAMGCAAGGAPSTSDPVSAVYLVELTVATPSSLPTCTAALRGAVAHVMAPPSIWACENNQWVQIPCTIAKSGSVAYASTTQTLWACVNKQWTQIALPDAGPPGPPGPRGPQGDAGAESLVKLTAESMGHNCAAGGQRIDVGIDKNGDGILEPSEITQTAYVCNGVGSGGNVDASVDASTADAADGSQAVDAGDASDAANAKVIPPGLLAYPGQYATAICTAFAGCCGATFDVTACKAAFTTQGYDNTLPGNPNTYANGNLTFNQTRAAACVAALQSWPCGATITSAQNQAILSACHGVLGGTIPIGGTGCLSSFECVSGAYCDPTGLVCRALVGAGGACDGTGESPDRQCSYIATGLPARYCNVYPTDGGAGASSGAGTCQPVQANGATSRCSDGVSIYSDYACSNRLCDFANTATCVGSTTNPAAPGTGFECGNFVIAAGGGG